ncbi:dysbindin domain-containing protein 1 [Callorhinchus milii]|uniref:Dysbindin domain-containing protein 1 n=1 Tax=Callorhinchus milii TaxID=7868 RepID=V9LGK6_CALMI|nr:dysbindin domain-containing protein 1 [Callorhinchus milii]XP_007887523.1 dysbindin domain-containing protein 1 [Callorhinchus milii]|eukprot:gi/632944462/ref/XP_007887522.1/ PREDICTED: dysbindin domain-containing protein 1 [Callorhinchus milii]
MEKQGGVAAQGDLDKSGRTPEKTIVCRHSAPTESHFALVDAEDGIPISTSGLLQVAERRQPLSSVSSLEVHFDLMDLTELTDMSDQELAEVFADSDEENPPHDSPPDLNQPLTHLTIPRGAHLKSPSWTRAKGELGREKKHLSEPDTVLEMPDHFHTVERLTKP